MSRAIATGKSVTVGRHVVTVREKIGEGGYAVVYRCEDSAGRQFALKSVNCVSLEKFEQFKQEAIVLQSLPPHPNIVKLHAADVSPSDLHISFLFEHCPSNAIQMLLKRTLTKHEILIFFYACANATAFLHSQVPPVIHRDLKPENLLVDREGVVKLCDFGSATTKIALLKDAAEVRAIQDDIEQNTTLNYRSPEMVDLYRRLPIDQKSDVWALGCALYKLIAKDDMFKPDERLPILQGKCRIPQGCDSDLERLLRMCVQLEPQARPTAAQVAEMALQLRGSVETIAQPAPTRAIPTPKHGVVKSRSQSKVSSGSFEKWITKATSASFYPPKEKYVRRVVVATIRNKELLVKAVKVMLKENWQGDPRVAAKIGYLLMQVIQFAEDLTPLFDSISAIQSITSHYMVPVDGNQQKKNWVDMAAALTGLVTSKLNFHRLAPDLAGNCSCSGEYDVKAPVFVGTMIRRTSALGSKLFEIASQSGDFSAVVFIQPFVEEMISLFNVLRYLKPGETELSNICTAMFEKAKVLPYLESCIEYPSDIQNKKPSSRF